MGKHVKKLILIILVSILASCSVGVKNKQPQLASSYQDNAIIISYNASENLNFYNGQKHTLKLAIVQVEKIEDIQKDIISSEALGVLLDSANGNGNDKELDDKNSKYYIQSLIVTPGTTRTYTFARMAGAKQIIIVAGYYDLIPKQVVRIFEIPVFEHWKPITFWEVDRRMGRIAICLQLGAQGINITDTTSKETTNDYLK
ncbi:TPA: hypothetical protein JAN72_15435 [Legionella pneumophila]|nr:hypothetical protein [Legionella pneumophila]HAU1272561.1 type VI secretion lipoprotein TssJ [Legionella pneumophila]HAU1510038.1 type VI secretion lipoprotein TssJ [Legionella pneumophila]